MPVCCVPGCKNNSRNAKKRNVSLHQFPSHPATRKKWLKFCLISSRDEENLTRHVCSSHFSENCMERNLKAELLNTIPTRRLITNGK